MNVPLLERCLLDLMETNTCDMPVFDFENHCPHPYTRRIRFGEREIAVVEGIHALNPAISRHLPEDGVLKIYISVKQGFEEQGEALLSPNQVRLVRRLVRDSLFRNTQPGPDIGYVGYRDGRGAEIHQALSRGGRCHNQFPALL